jgi:hypothetical protein
MLPSECLSPLRAVEGCLVVMGDRCRVVENRGAIDRWAAIGRWRSVATRGAHRIALLATSPLLAPWLLTPPIQRRTGVASPRRSTETA